MSETNTGMLDTSVNTEPATEAAPAPTAAPDATPQDLGTNVPNPGTQAPVLQNGQPVPPPFQPDWKFKVKDKEFEIDDWARGIAKDEETYKNLKRVWERHKGLDEVLTTRDQLKQKWEQAEPKLKEYEQVSQRLNEISHYFNSGDLDSFFETLQIPFDTIFNYVKTKAQMAQMPPEVQQRLESARQANREAYTYKQRVQQFEQTEQQARQEQVMQHIESVIQSKAGDVSTKYNEMMGDNSAFRNFVIMKGQSLFNSTGQQLPADQVVEMARQDLAKLFGTVQAPSSPTPSSPQQAQAPGQNPSPPVIPAVKAGAQSPVRTPPKSIDDLKKMASQL